MSENKAGKTDRLNLLICGFQRSASTALARYLDEHPEIAIVEERDLMVDGKCVGPPFASPWVLESRHGQDGAVYREIAARVARRVGGPVAYVGIKETYYVLFPHIPLNIREHLPEAKLLFILRNPVDAIYSGFCHVKRNGNPKVGDFSQWVTDVCEKREIQELQSRADWNAYARQTWLAQARATGGLPLLVERGFYYEQLVRYFRLFDADQILVLRYDELAGSPQTLVCQVLDFLGLSSSVELTRVGTVVNAQAKYPPMAPETRSRLQEIFAESNRRVLKLLGWPQDLWD